MDESIRLGRIAGVRVGLNWSVLVVYSLIAWVLAVVQLPLDFPGYSTAAYWLAGIVVATLFFGCLLAHEMAHALVARRDGVEVEGITLWLFGGVAKLRGDSMNARSELRIALAGPATSLCLAGALVALAFAADAAGAPLLITGSTLSLAVINALLAGFNMVPAFPLDGGRVLRSLLWRRLSRARSTTIAAWGGRIFGLLLAAAGVFSLVLGDDPLQGGWFLFLGWFMFSAARMEESHVLLREGLNGLTVREVMSIPPVVASSDTTARELAELAELYGVSTVPVRGPDGIVTGTVHMDRVLAISKSRRESIMVGDIARSLGQQTTATPRDSLAELLDRMPAKFGGYALVLERDELVGVVTEADLQRAVRHATSL